MVASSFGLSVMMTVQKSSWTISQLGPGPVEASSLRDVVVPVITESAIWPVVVVSNARMPSGNFSYFPLHLTSVPLIWQLSM